MAQKTVTAHVYGKEYTLACDAGQEQHLHSLIDDMNSRIAQLEKAVGKLPEPLMLLYSSLMVADELHDTKRELTLTKDDLNHVRQQVNETGDDARLAALEEEVAGNIQALAERLDGLADKLAA